MRRRFRLPPYVPLFAFACLIFLVSLPLRRLPNKPLPAPTPTSVPPLVNALVVLDPGHGGVDSGAIRGGMREDALTYRLTAEISSELRQRGAEVWTTVDSNALSVTGNTPFVVPKDACLAFNNTPLGHRRESGAQELWQRAALVRKAIKVPGKKVFFLSLHADSLASRKWWGARVYRDTRDKGECRFAKHLLARLSRAGMTYKPNGKIVPRDYGVLNPAYNPAPQKALMEAFTISSPKDRERARSPIWRQKIVVSVADSVQASL